jgi:hypothetical protein
MGQVEEKILEDCKAINVISGGLFDLHPGKNGG